MSEFWDRVRDEVLEDLRHNVNGTLVSHQKHPEFAKSVTDLARKSELPSVPHIVIIDKLPIGPVWAHKLPNAGALPINAVVVNKSMLELTGSSLKKPMSPELETVLAHEFGHLKGGPGSFYTRFIPIFTLPLVAGAGMWLYDRARERTERKQAQSKEEYISALTGNIHKEADAENNAVQSSQGHPNKWNFNPNWQRGIIHLARGLVASAVGLGAGLLATRQMSLNAEYKADAFAVKVTGNPETYKKVLSDMTAVFQNLRPDMPPHDSFRRIVGEKIQWLIGNTIRAHPDLADRLAHIDSVSKH